MFRYCNKCCSHTAHIVKHYDTTTFWFAVVEHSICTVCGDRTTTLLDTDRIPTKLGTRRIIR